MFTGIIKSKGKIVEIKKSKDGKNRHTFSIQPEKNIFEDKEIGSSIAVNGACLTLIKTAGNKMDFDVMDETIKLTNLKDAEIGDTVNLEPALKLGDSLDGHFVQGHIEALGEIAERRKEKNQEVFKIKYPPEYSKYMAFKGSITVNGVSLTISFLDRDYFEVSAVKHTLENTNFENLKKGDKVNLEFDLIAKHIESLLNKKDEETKYAYLVERNLI